LRGNLSSFRLAVESEGVVKSVKMSSTIGDSLDRSSVDDEDGQMVLLILSNPSPGTNICQTRELRLTV
jgi:hypothetical protein